MSSIAKNAATGLALARSFQRITFAGRSRHYLREITDNQACAQMNLFMFLKERQQRRRIKQISRRNTWERIYNDLDFEALAWDPFDVVNLGALQQALEKGHGALLATQHVGPYRRLFYELIRRGFKVNMVFDAQVSATTYQRVKAQLARQKKSMPDLEDRLLVINAEQSGSARQILRALKRNEPVMIYLDGNTGVGGQGETGQHGVTVDFFGHQIAVRKGTCHLAYLAKAPIIPLFATWDDGRKPRMEFFDPIVPEPHSDVDEFCRQGMQKLYTLSETVIRKNPEQFEEWFHVHRWRVSEAGGQPEGDAAALKETYKRFEQELTEGSAQYRIDQTKALIVTLGGRELLVDGERGRMLKARPLTRVIIKELAVTRTLKSLMAQLQKQYSQKEVLQELTRLSAVDLIEKVEPDQHATGSLTRRLRRRFRFVSQVVGNCLRYPEKRHYMEVLRNTYYTDYINLSLAFRRTRSEREIRALARQAVFTYLKNTAVRNVPEAWEGFELHNSEALQEALSLNRGAVVVSEHLGPQQFAFIELANRGYLINAAISEIALEKVQPWVDQLIRELRSPQHAIDGKQIEKYLHIISVENPTSALRMVRALKRGEIVMFDLDGNLGVGGEEGTRAEAFTVTFLGREVHVRRGAAYLSYKTGAPIVPVVPSWNAGRAHLTFHDPIQVEPGETLEHFCQRSLQRLYGILEARVLEEPAEWEMWPEFYKWLSPSLTANSQNRVSELMRSSLTELQRKLDDANDCQFRIDPRTVFVVKIKRRHLLIDVLGFRFFLVNRSTREILKLLYQDLTLQTIIRRLKHKYPVTQILKDLARLRVLHLIEEKA